MRVLLGNWLQCAYHANQVAFFHRLKRFNIALQMRVALNNKLSPLGIGVNSKQK